MPAIAVTHRPGARAACGTVLRLRHTLLFACAFAGAAQADCLWTGAGADASWSTPANWLCTSAPLPRDGDSLTFPPTSARFASVNDLPDLELANLVFSGPGYLVDGVSLAVSGQVATTASGAGGADGDVELRLPIVLAGSSSGVACDADIDLHLAGGVATDNGTHVFDAACTLSISAPITGSGALTKAGPGVLVLASANAYSGSTTIAGGILRAVDPAALGPGGSTTVADGATLLLDGVGVASEPLLLSGAGFDGAGALQGTGGAVWDGPIVLSADAAVGNAQPGSAFAIGGVIGGAGALTKMGVGDLILGNAGNSYTGQTNVNQGVLTITASSALGGSAGGGTVVASDAALALAGDLLVDEVLVLDGSSAPAMLVNASEDNTWFGSIQLIGAAYVDVAAGTQLTWNSGAGGTGGLTKVGAGRLVLAAANSHSGATTVDGGTLEVLGSTGDIVVGSGGVLTGQGEVGALAVFAGGRVAPSGVLSATSLNWQSGGTLAFALGSSTLPTTRLNLSGVLQKGVGSDFRVAFDDAAGGAAMRGVRYRLVSHLSTNMTGAEIVYTYNGQPGLTSLPGAFVATSTRLEFEAIDVSLFGDGFEGQ